MKFNQNVSHALLLRCYCVNCLTLETMKMFFLKAWQFNKLLLIFTMIFVDGKVHEKGFSNVHPEDWICLSLL